MLARDEPVDQQVKLWRSEGDVRGPERRNKFEARSYEVLAVENDQGGEPFQPGLAQDVELGRVVGDEITCGRSARAGVYSEARNSSPEPKR